MASVQLSDINKYFKDGNQALKNINLHIKDGEFVIFVGPSGSGKSTLLRTLAGLEQVSSGTITVADQDVTASSPREREVAMVFQNYALYPHMTVAKNITFGMRVRKESKEAQQAALKRVISMLQLDGLLERKPRQLSGGQRQRVAMARAIVRNPKIFLMDEPLSNLDAKLRNEVRLSIMKLQKELACTMVYVTHDQIEAMTMADRVVVLNQGQIQQVGTPQELYHYPNNQFTAGFIGTPAMNFLPLKRNGHSFMLPGGTSLQLNEQLTRQLDNHEGVTLGLRPEHLFTTSNDCRAFQNQQTCTLPQVNLKTTITNLEMLGSEFLIHTDLDHNNLKFRHKNNQTLPDKQAQTELHFSLANCHFFDQQSGHRLN